MIKQIAQEKDFILNTEDKLKQTNLNFQQEKQRIIGQIEKIRLLENNLLQVL